MPTKSPRDKPTAASKQTAQLLDHPRFENPKACLSYDNEGRPMYGLPDSPGRVPLAHQYEAAKAAANAALQDQRSRPSAQRMAPRHTAEEDWARRRQLELEQEQRRLSSPRNQARAPYLVTSPDNLLKYGGDGAEYAGQAAGPEPPFSPGARRVQSIRTFGGGVLPPSQQSHLGAGFFPRGDEEEERRRAEDRTAQSERTLGQFSAARALGRELCQEYPHGLTRLALAKVRSEGGPAALLADLPSLDLAR